MNYMICSGFETEVYLIDGLRFIVSYGFVWKINGELSQHVFYDESVKRILGFNGNVYVKCGKNKYWIWFDGAFVKVEDSVLLAELNNVGAEIRKGPFLYRQNSDNFPQVKHELFGGQKNFSALLENQILLAAYDDGFVFHDYKNNSVIKYDLNFEIFQEHEFLCERIYTAYSSKLNCRYFVVLLRSPQAVSLVQIFDTSKFQVVSAFESDSPIKGVFQYQVSDEYVFFRADDNLMRVSLVGGELVNLFKGRKVNNVSLKESFTYLSFLGDSNVYVYDTACESLVSSFQGPGGYEVNALEAGGVDNCAIEAVLNSKMSSGLRYATFWKDSEISLSQDVILEEPIFTVSRVPEEHGFSLNILIDNSENYSVAARHALSALDECIYEHGLFMGRAHSPEFTGVVEWQFKNGALLSLEQRDQLKTAGTYMLEDKYSMFKGAATGDDCSLSIRFD